MFINTLLLHRHTVSIWFEYYPLILDTCGDRRDEAANHKPSAPFYSIYFSIVVVVVGVHLNLYVRHGDHAESAALDELELMYSNDWLIFFSHRLIIIMDCEQFITVRKCKHVVSGVFDWISR